MSRVWFSADLHLGHANIIRFCKRPFKHVDEMNEALISNWNSVVRPGDRVYLLGDVGFGRPDWMKKTVWRLMGDIHLIRGNHDKDGVVKALQDRFVWIKDYFELKHESERIILSHYPFLTWNGCHHGSWNLHGHCHGTLPHQVNTHSRRLDVGVDCHNYFPVSFEDVRDRLEKIEFNPVDGHGNPDTYIK